MEIVLNKCFGGFSLSKAACDHLGLSSPYDEIERTDPKLVECVRALGEMANGPFSELTIKTIPNTATDWEIYDYDGVESVTYVVNGKLYHT